jgi:hypothetical protein
MAVKTEVEEAAVRVLKGWVILCHWISGWPTMTLPKSRVPLLALRIGVAVRR